MRRALPDGTELEVRPIDAADKPLLQEHFAHLGSESRYRRFLGPHTVLSDTELRYFTELDHVLHEGLMAFHGREPVGVARYIAVADAPDEAEIAFGVTDEWQGRGVGAVLARELAERARANGVRRFTASILGTNRPMVRLLHTLGAPWLIDRDGSTTDWVVELPA